MHKITRNRRNKSALSYKRGQTLVEYALVLAVISVVAIGSLLSMGGQVSGVYTTIDAQLNSSRTGGVTAPAHNH